MWALIKVVFRVAWEILIALFTICVFDKSVGRWMGTKIATTIAHWGVVNEVNMAIIVGMYLSVTCFCIGLILYGLELFEIFDFKRVKEFYSPKMFGKLGFFPVLMLNMAILFFLLMELKKTLILYL